MRREEAIVKLEWYLNSSLIEDISGCEGVEEAISMAIEALGAEPKKGKWNVYYHGDADFSYSCRECGYSAPYDMKGGKVFQKKWNYCPNCGADMRGEEDG